MQTRKEQEQTEREKEAIQDEVGRTDKKPRKKAGPLDDNKGKSSDYTHTMTEKAEQAARWVINYVTEHPGATQHEMKEAALDLKTSCPSLVPILNETLANLLHDDRVVAKENTTTSWLGQTARTLYGDEDAYRYYPDPRKDRTAKMAATVNKRREELGLPPQDDVGMKVDPADWLNGLMDDTALAQNLTLSDEEKTAFRSTMEGMIKLAGIDGPLAMKTYRGIMTLVRTRQTKEEPPERGIMTLVRTRQTKEEPPEHGIIFDVKVGDDGRITIPEATREKHSLYNKILSMQVVSQFEPGKKQTSTFALPPWDTVIGPNPRTVSAEFIDGLEPDLKRLYSEYNEIVRKRNDR